MQNNTFSALGIEIKTAQQNARAICPRCADVHNNQKKTLSCDTVRGLFQCFRCGWSGRVGGNIGWTDRRPDPSELERNRWKRQRAIDRLMRESVPITDPIAMPARTYLGRRMGRILGRYPALHFHPKARYYRDGQYQVDHPTLIGEVRDINGRLITFHRTYLTHDGRKADLDPVRKLMGVPVGSCTGAAIRLSAATDTLVLCEGIETALALSLKLHMPAWACISAHGLETVLVPDSVQRVYIGADHDRNNTGQRAARRLAHRLWTEGCKNIEIHTPDQAGTDWCDELRNKNDR
ncbi:hypothetical protein MNBD_GAMMA13-1869 [hydrothermal vent metagenome]|uniref:Uncharacterized protein n=1 Tax=hydrothermal vent metagenome TaxID=652676 RepID=A0A3B0XVC8_9ZZZZ